MAGRVLPHLGSALPATPVRNGRSVEAKAPPVTPLQPRPAEHLCHLPRAGKTDSEIGVWLHQSHSLQRGLEPVRIRDPMAFEPDWDNVRAPEHALLRSAAEC